MYVRMPVAGLLQTIGTAGIVQDVQLQDKYDRFLW